MYGQFCGMKNSYGGYERKRGGLGEGKRGGLEEGTIREQGISGVNTNGGYVVVVCAERGMFLANIYFEH